MVCEYILINTRTYYEAVRRGRTRDALTRLSVLNRHRRAGRVFPQQCRMANNWSADRSLRLVDYPIFMLQRGFENQHLALHSHSGYAPQAWRWQTSGLGATAAAGA